jgi:hypothetical protein
VVAEARVQTENLGDDEYTDNDQAERADLSENLLQVASGIVVLANKRRRATEEGVGASGNNNTFSFTLLAGRTAASFISKHS